MMIPILPGMQTAEEVRAQVAASLNAEDIILLNIYPNPSSIGLVNISSNVENASYTITTIDGSLVSSGLLSTQREIIDVSSMSPGLYLIKISNDCYSITKK